MSTMEDYLRKSSLLHKSLETSFNYYKDNNGMTKCSQHFVIQIYLIFITSTKYEKNFVTRAWCFFYIIHSSYL